MSAENVAVVRRMFEHYFRGDTEAALAMFAEDVEWRDQFAIYHGRPGVAESVARWTGVWNELEMELDEVLDGGDDVVVFVRQTGRGKGSGAPIEGVSRWVYTLAEGRIVSVRQFADPDEALRAAGLSGR
jgi:ketosteroid isomerase-like protein